MSYGIPGTRVTAYTFDADYHCIEDTEKQFGVDEHGSSYGTDSEGNEIHPTFTSDEQIPNFAVCADCGRVICLTCGETDAYYNLRSENGAVTTCSNCGSSEETEPNEQA